MKKRKRPFKHLILLSIDALRFDALSAETETSYLTARGLAGKTHTPHLDRFANEGLRFARCFSASPQTPTSHATMLTGHLPFRHGVRPFLHEPLWPASKTLFRRLSNAGFKTLLSSDSLEFFQITRIHDGASELFCGEDARVLDSFEAKAKKGESVFLFSHMTDVHFPYGECDERSMRACDPEILARYLDIARSVGVEPPPRAKTVLRRDWRARRLFFRDVRNATQDSRHAVELLFPLYLEGVRRFDGHRFKRFFGKLEKLGLLEEALIVITADHGEGAVEPDWTAGHFAKHTRFDHLECVADELLRVPLIFWSKNGAIPKGVEGSLVSLADVTPTLLKLLKVPFEAESLDGESRADLVSGKTPSTNAREDSLCYAEAWYSDQEGLNQNLKNLRLHMNFSGGSSSTLDGPMPAPTYKNHLHQRTLRSASLKIVETLGQGFTLYDWVHDPLEKHDLSKVKRAEAARLREKLERMAGATVKPRKNRNALARLPELNSDLIFRMKSLGYLD